jgi:hypothetical protein
LEKLATIFVEFILILFILGDFFEFILIILKFIKQLFSVKNPFENTKIMENILENLTLNPIPFS